MKLITVKEVSKILSIKQSTIYAWAAKGQIPSLKLNGVLRFDLETIEEWVKSTANTPQEAVIIPFPTQSFREVDAIIKNAVESEKPKGYNNPQTGNRLESSPKKGGSDGAL